MAIQVNGTTVIDNSRALTNISSVDATTVAALGTAGVGGGGLTMLQDTTISSTISYIDYTFPSGYEIFHFLFRRLHTDDTNTDRNLGLRLKDTSNNLLTGNNYFRATNASASTYSSDGFYDWYTMGAANKSFSPTGFLTIYSPKDSATQTMIESISTGVFSYNSSDFQSFTNRAARGGYYYHQAHNGVRFFPQNGGNIHSSSVSYQIWGVKDA